MTFHPYSDFLLHDMGDLGDGITQNLATGKSMRTAPLWGLRKVTTYLHDGRATTLDAAIVAHQGQAKKARDRYASLPNFKKTWLVAFLNSVGLTTWMDAGGRGLSAAHYEPYRLLAETMKKSGR